MLGYSLFLLESIGLKHAVFNTHHAPDSIRYAAERLSKPSYKVSFSHEAEILGSGGGLWQASQLLDKTQPVFLMNGDVVSLSNDTLILNKFKEFHEQQGALATLLCCPHEEVGKSLGGVFTEKATPEAGFDWARVKTFSKTLVPGLTGYHFASVMLFSPKIFEYLPAGSSNILYEVLVKAIAAGEKVLAYVDPTLQWFETGDPKNYLDATRICLNTLNQNSSQARYLEAILKRFTPGWDNYKKEGVYSNQPIADNVAIKSGSQGIVGRAVKLSQGCQLKDFFVVGEGSSLAEGSQLESSVLLPQGRLHQNEKLYSALK